MHEMALAEGVLQLVDRTAAREGARRVRRVVLEIGRLAAVEPEALRFCFDLVMTDSIAQGAELEIIDIPGVGWCPSCQGSVPMAALYADCPNCGGYHLQITDGTQMRVREIEIEE